ncbi:hypothetical protein R3P38DRAFT_3099188 [Favolaschia claudopus]|uniref:Uncharacterized protein n=1 Tax=Favolaschia claudopus TaxID=2862362 RepID=A0AAV9ZN08_9AGAR
MSSSILRCRLLPQRIPAAGQSRTTGFTPITENQIAQSLHLSSIPLHWSIAPDLTTQLVDRVTGDLDRLLPQQPLLVAAFTASIHRLVADWSEHFGDDSYFDYDQQETATTDASRLLLGNFCMSAVRAIQTAAITAGLASTDDDLKLRRKLAAPAAPSFIIDNSVRQDTTYTLGMEDKPSRYLPPAIAELTKRGLSCGVVEIEREATDHQPNWWIIANKGALYAAAYDFNWVVFGAMTAYCVGYRTADHMFWCPVINRRDNKDEVTPHADGTVAKLFGTGMMEKGVCPWLSQWFPGVSDLEPHVPSNEPQTHEYTIHGRDHLSSSSDDSSADSSDGDKSGDFIGSGSFPRTTLCDARSSGAISAGPYQFRGTWIGYLGEPSAVHVTITTLLSAGHHGVVYNGNLVGKGTPHTKVAIKASDDPDTLLAEYFKYEALKIPMGLYLPKCYGLFLTSHSAFLIMGLVSCPKRKGRLSKAERCVYEFSCLLLTNCTEAPYLRRCAPCIRQDGPITT